MPALPAAVQAVLAALALLAALLPPFTGSALAGTAPPAAAGHAAAAEPVRLTLPAPTGESPVGVVKAHLVDRGRADPWKPDRNRELMISIWYPARQDTRRPLAPWLSPGVAPVFENLMAHPDYLAIPSGSVDWAGTRSHARVAAPVRIGDRPWPLVLFSPAQGTTRELNTVLVEDLASRGYVVVTIDHTYEEAAVEFPGGRVELGLNLDRSPETQKKAIDSRVADTRFVLDRLTGLSKGGVDRIEGTALPAGLHKAFSPRPAGMFGHVHGGYTAVETMYSDARIGAAVDLDGGLAHGDGKSGRPYVPGQAAQHGVNGPVLLMGAGTFDDTGRPIDRNHVNGSDRSWTGFWAAQRAWKRDLTLSRSALDSYADFTFFLPQIAAAVPIRPEMIRLFIGDVDPAASLNAQRAYVGAFFDKFLRGRDSGLLDGPSPRYPDITFVTG